MVSAEERIREEARLQSIRQAVWDAWSDDARAFDRLHDVLVDAVIGSSPSREQVKAVFMMLPAFIIGKAISWGLNDTEVGDNMYVFLEENEAAVRARLATVPA